MKPPSSLDALIEALRCLPGVGPKSAQRMAYHLMQYERGGAQKLSESIARALQSNAAAQMQSHQKKYAPWQFAAARRVAVAVVDARRSADDGTDAGFSRNVLKLMRRLSPSTVRAEGHRHGPVAVRATDGVVREVVLATNFTNEGEATAHYRRDAAQRDVKVTHRPGVPVGGEPVRG
jgi:recombination protein RecR